MKLYRQPAHDALLAVKKRSERKAASSSRPVVKVTLPCSSIGEMITGCYLPPPPEN